MSYWNMHQEKRNKLHLNRAIFILHALTTSVESLRTLKMIVKSWCYRKESWRRWHKEENHAEFHSNLYMLVVSNVLFCSLSLSRLFSVYYHRVHTILLSVKRKRSEHTELSRVWGKMMNHFFSKSSPFQPLSLSPLYWWENMCIILLSSLIYWFSIITIKWSFTCWPKNNNCERVNIK